MINSVLPVAPSPTFKGLITGTKAGVKQPLFSIESTPYMDDSIISVLDQHGLPYKSQIMRTLNLDIEGSLFKEIMKLLKIPDEFIKGAWNCTIEKVRPLIDVKPKKAGRQSKTTVIHNIQIKINSDRIIFIDLNKKNQGLRNLKPVLEAVV